jgi:imidazolonepropionase-like amidohydrolase
MVWDIAVEARPAADRAAAVRAAGDAAKAAGLPLIVHATELETAREAVAAGARLLVHSVEDLAVDEELLSAMRARGTLYCPTLTVIDGYVRMFTAAAAAARPSVDDPHHCVDPATRRKVEETAALHRSGEGFDPAAMQRRIAARHAVQADNLRRVVAAGIPVAAGTDAGNPLTLHGPAIYAELEAMQAAGMEPMAVLVAATRNGARAMGREADLGTVERGKVADLLVLDADPTRDAAAFRSLRAVVRAGVVHGVEELAAAVAAGDPAAGK